MLGEGSYTVSQLPSAGFKTLRSVEVGVCVASRYASFWSNPQELTRCQDHFVGDEPLPEYEDVSSSRRSNLKDATII